MDKVIIPFNPLMIEDTDISESNKIYLEGLARYINEKLKTNERTLITLDELYGYWDEYDNTRGS